MISEREKECKREWLRRVRAERKALGLCRDCGKAADHPTLKQVCLACGEKQHARSVRLAEREKAKRAAEGRCRLPAPDVTCPDCGGRCRRHGRNKKGRPQFRCIQCGRMNLGTGRRIRFRVAAKGAARHKLSLAVGWKADEGLRRYCREYRVSTGEAIRRIFREAATRGPVLMAVGIRAGVDAFGDPVVRIRHMPPPTLRPGELPVQLPRRLPDLRGEAARRRLRLGGVAMYRPQILIVRNVVVALDDLAFAGLLQTAQHHGLTHQEAARLLLERHRFA